MKITYKISCVTPFGKFIEAFNEPLFTGSVNGLSAIENGMIFIEYDENKITEEKLEEGLRKEFKKNNYKIITLEKWIKQ